MIDFKELMKLVESGCERAESVEGKGEFSVSEEY